MNVKVNMPEDVSKLNKVATEVLAKILINKLPENEINQLIELLKDDTIDIKM